MDLNKICYNCMQIKPQESGSCPHCGFINEEYQSSDDCLSPMKELNGQYLSGKVLRADEVSISYIALDMHSQRVVVIKEFFLKDLSVREENGSVSVLSKDRSYFEEKKKRFVQESRILAMFHEKDDEGVFVVKDSFEENNTVYMIKEYLRGDTLTKCIQEKSLRFEEMISLMEPVCHALMKIHQFGVVHLNVSPDNIIFSNDKTAKLIDFGEEKSVGIRQNSSTALRNGYIPVEQCVENGRIGQWTDVYSTAAVMYFCLTGCMPTTAMERKSGAVLERPSQKGAELPKIAEDAVMKALELNPENRYQTIEEFWDALSIKKKRTGSGGFSSQSKDGKDRKNIRKGLFVGIAAVIISAIGLYSMSLNGEKEADPSLTDEAVSESETNENVYVEVGEGFHESDMVEGITGKFGIFSVFDEKICWRLNSDEDAYPEPTVVTACEEELTADDLSLWFEFVPTGFESRYKIYPVDQTGDVRKCLEYHPDSNGLVVREESDNQNQLFRIIYVTSNQYLLQAYNESVLGFDLSTDGTADGQPVLARPYDAIEDSRLETWFIRWE